MNKKFTLIIAAALTLVCGGLFAAAEKGYTFENGIFTIDRAGDWQVTYYSPASKYGHVNDFGAVVNGEKVQLDTHLTGNETVTIFDLKKGDKVGFYMGSDSYDTLYSDKEGEPGDPVFAEARKGDISYFTFGNEKWSAGDVIAFRMAGGGSPEPMSGQPLPGILTTLAISAVCGGAAGRFGRGKKRA